VDSAATLFTPITRVSFGELRMAAGQPATSNQQPATSTA
jgi:hypothetical protein